MSQAEGEGEVSPVRLEMPQAEEPPVLSSDAGETEQVEEMATNVEPQHTEPPPMVSKPFIESNKPKCYSN